VALIHQAHPGEEVTVRIDRTTAGTMQGRVASLIVRDSHRWPHPCAHEFACTGCPFLALDPAAESRFKQDRVRAVLLGIGGLPEPDPILRPTEPFGYRHFAKQVFGREGDRVVLGSYVAGTHEVADNRGCPVLASPLPEILEALVDAVRVAGLAVRGFAPGAPGLAHAVARKSRINGDVLLGLVVDAALEEDVAAFGAAFAAQYGNPISGVVVIAQDRETNVILEGRLRPVAGRPWVEELILGHRHRVGLRTFFQINPEAAASLFGVVLEMAGTGGVCVEAYAGVGALTAILADRFARVIALENHPESQAELRRLAARAGIIRTVATSVEESLASVLSEERPDVLVLDPPRRGLGDAVVAVVGGAGVARVILLSCDPTTLARDLPGLLAAGYRVRRVVPVDQFPRTAHVETVTLLEFVGRTESSDHSMG
jgi:23S rRNA (uracil1939-C5)-methyltransferase